ncbi:NADH-ubiquinone oxidoreductase 39-40 kDa subunit [Gluconobacter thailandicus F149-1 = NBRC 100600]|uniref:Transmembrane oxidoreductase n=1 Tax=Gluconobacter thailandicus NBRC 3257 TaxID=1381097 RepID=A0ABQ0ITP4_GLUTH|nr:NAD(P)H-binding protein [Gluconobacter thailandicus]KXV54053.1 NADH-ubiquinone oxidoreductase [Gluconobacter thailandicus]GAC88831.1 transmembrane oxidoreductase [Gluconobacter thailandicus NBRC 3255]GAD25581.1 transmembrane oxidoreductase [Gluconobacter thailandicus NBRC 3257]GAN94376.1 NADH-ubiquinone oxidoreductase 39-40 kDa subunit [Gluconobacter thailandicus F149-1 = NBRC 100600]GBR61747.1 NADH-ubiquinone oxidoreductase 39-40 kDa subunit [Gluconobacter thailandicus F149-1 = NBRC 100600
MTHPTDETGNICVIGASGRSGTALCRALIENGNRVIAVVRNRGKLAPDLADACVAVRQADVTDSVALPIALENAAVVVNTAHARHLPDILAATHAPIVALGSTRKFTRWLDDHGRGVLAGEAALQADGRPSILLHPTMIYGAQGEDNVQRLALLLERLPIIPLPGGGRSLVQPINQQDVTRSVIAAINLLLAGKVSGPESLVIAGPNAVPYRTFVRMILYFSGLGGRPVISLPGWLLMAASRVTRHLPKLPKIAPEEVRRLLEDKNFDITPMRNRLGINPIPLETGLQQLLSAPPSNPV